MLDETHHHPLAFDPLPKKKVQKKIDYYYAPYMIGQTRDQKMTFGGKNNNNGWGKVESLIYTHDVKYFKRINRMLHKVPELKYKQKTKAYKKPPSPTIDVRQKPPPLLP